MRNLLLMSSLLALGACGMSEDKFADKFAEAYCDQISECGVDIDCPEAGGTEVPDTCEYDKGNAKDCINGEWGCDDNDFPTIPDACANVYDCGAATNTATNTTTNTTTGS